MTHYFRRSAIYSSRIFFSCPIDVAQSPAATCRCSLLQETVSNKRGFSTVHHLPVKTEELDDNVDIDELDVGIRGVSLSDEVEFPQSEVGIFWDLENKPPISVPPYEAAIKLRKTFKSFGIVKHMVTYANRRAFSYVPPEVRELRNERMVLNHLENKGIIKPIEPCVCKVCGRKFNTNVKLMNHFTIHEREHQKRANQIRSLKGKKKDGLINKYAKKLEKYKIACRGVVIPEVGYGLADELKRAGFRVKTVSDRPQTADIALRNHMIDLMDLGQVQCLVLVSDDSDFVDVLKEARERCVKTVVVGDHDNGVLMRNADGFFSWRDIIAGKAKTEAVSVMRQWREGDTAKRLELNDPAEVEKDANKLDDSCEFEDQLDKDGECGDSTEDDDKPWWKLD